MTLDKVIRAETLREYYDFDKKISILELHVNGVRVGLYDKETGYKLKDAINALSEE